MSGEAEPAVEAPLKRYVTLVSGDGHEVTISRDAANLSRTIREMLQGTEHLEGDDGASATPRFELHDIAGNVLELVGQYLSEKLANHNAMSEFRQLKAMDPKSEQDRQMVLELLLAADYLDC
jgi:transcription elongation factor B subunit 1